MLGALRRSLMPLQRLLPACTAALPAAAAASADTPTSGSPWHAWHTGGRGVVFGQHRDWSSSASEEPAHPAAASQASPQHGQHNVEEEQQEQRQRKRQHDERHMAGTPSHTHSSSFADEEASWHHEEGPAFEAQRSALLAAALRHVPDLGWGGGAAAAAAAQELGLSPAAAGMLGSDAELVQLFFGDCNRRLESELAARHAELAEMPVRERLQTGLRLRLSMLEPVIASWPQALSLLAQPAAALRTLRLYADVADAVWHSAGDASTDLSWYSKRAVLAGVYSSSELYMLTDSSPGFADTWAAVDRRLDDAAQLRAAAEQGGALAGAVGGAASAVAAQLESLFRPRPPV